MYFRFRTTKLTFRTPYTTQNLCLQNRGRFRTAATLADYEQLHREAQARNQKAAEEMMPWWKKHNELITQKTRIIKMLNLKIEEEGLKKGDFLKVSLVKLREEGWIVNKITDEYLQTQKQLNLSYKILVTNFSSYYNEEKDHQLKFNRYTAIVSQATHNEELIEARQAMEVIYLNEENRHSFLKIDASKLSLLFRTTFHTYEKKIEKHRTFLTEFDFPRVPNPAIAVEHLESMIAYLDSRYNVYLGHLDRIFDDITQKSNQLILKDLAIWSAARELQQKYYKSSMNFVELAHAIIQNLGAIMDEAASAKYIHGGILMPQYTAYEELLAYKSTCKNMKQMKSHGSPLFSGCALLLDLIEEAELFMKTDGWLKIGAHLTRMNDIPEDFKSKKSKLRSLKTQSRTGKPSLLEAIKIHDSIITQWNSVDSGNV